MSSKSVMDDFKEIHGIGASVEDRLHKAGILTYSQLAAKTPQEITNKLKGMVGFTPERIANQNWTGQAQQYATNKSRAPDQENDLSNSLNHQHYEVFTVELLVDDENIVRRTSVTHVQSKEKELWAGWDGNRLQDYVIERSAILIPEIEEESGINKDIVNPKPEIISEPKQPNQMKLEAALEKDNLTINDQVRILELEPHYTGLRGGTKRAIPENQPFNIRITLDLTKIDLPVNVPINYLATIYAKKVGTGVHQTLGASQSNFMPADNVIIDVGVKRLTRGSYRIDAVLTLSLPETESMPKTIPGAISEGAVIHVY